MKTQPLQVNDTIIIECSPVKGSMNNESETLELVSACREYHTPLLLLNEGVLPEALIARDWLLNH